MQPQQQQLLLLWVRLVPSPDARRETRVASALASSSLATAGYRSTPSAMVDVDSRPPTLFNLTQAAAGVLMPGFSSPDSSDATKDMSGGGSGINGPIDPSSVDPAIRLQSFEISSHKLALVLGITFAFILLLLFSLICIFYVMGLLQNVFGYSWGPPMGRVLSSPLAFCPEDLIPGQQANHVPLLDNHGPMACSHVANHVGSTGVGAGGVGARGQAFGGGYGYGYGQVVSQLQRQSQIQMQC